MYKVEHKISVFRVKGLKFLGRAGIHVSLNFFFMEKIYNLISMHFDNLKKV